MLHDYSVFLLSPASPLDGGGTNDVQWICSHVPGNQHAKTGTSKQRQTQPATLLTDWSNYALPVTSKPATSRLAAFAHCPSEPYERFERDLVDGKSGSNHVAIQWERAVQPYYGELVKLLVENKSILPSG